MDRMASQDRVAVRGGKEGVLLRLLMALLAAAPAAAGAKTIVGIGIAKSDDVVYTWFADGTFTKGSSSELQKYRQAYPYAPPDGLAPAQIVAMSIAGDDHVYTWYGDQTVSEGNSGDLAKYHARASVTLPGGKTMADIVGIGIAASDDHVYAWYRDQTVSVGKSRDLAYYQPPVHYDLPNDPFNPGTPLTPDEVVEMDIAKDDHVYAWYRNGFHSEGSSGHLGKYNFGPYIRSAVLYNFWKPAPATAIIPPGILGSIAGLGKPPPPPGPGYDEADNPMHAARVAASRQHGRVPRVSRGAAVAAAGASRGAGNAAKVGATRPVILPAGGSGPGSSGGPVTVRDLQAGINSVQKAAAGGSRDAMVAVGRSFVVITDATSIAFRDRTGGTLAASAPRITQGFSTGDFFSAFTNGTNEEIDLNRNSGFRAPCQSVAKGNGCLGGGGFYDTRAVYDPVSQRFFISAQVRNGITTLMDGMSLGNTNGQYNHPWACAYWHDPDAPDPKNNKVFTKDQTVCLMSRHLKVLAVSVSEDPRDGFHQYIYTGTTDADWPWIAVNGSRVVLSNWSDVNEPPQWPSPQPVVLVFNLPDVAAGATHPAFFAYFPQDLDDLRAVLPPVHHGNTQGLTFLVHGRESALRIYGIPDDADPWHAPPLVKTQEYGLSHNAPSAMGAAYRNGKLYFVDSTGEDKCVGASYMDASVRNGCGWWCCR